jgi:peptide/nickel transport system substrate-binding protein
MKIIRYDVSYRHLVGTAPGYQEEKMPRQSPAALRSFRIPIAILFVTCLLIGAHQTVQAGRSTAKVLSAAKASCSNIKLGGTFVYGVDQDVISFDAMNTQDNGSLWADQNIYDQLVRVSPDATKLQPDLANSWKITNGGKTITFNIRHNAKFYNGDPVTAADVAWSYNRVREKQTINAWSLQAVTSDKATGKYTFQVQLKTPWAPFLNDITLWGASIYDEKAFKNEGVNKWHTAPVGSGPFYVAKFLPGQYTLLKKNPYYWETDACGHHYPYVDAVKLQYLPNDNTRLAQLEAGNIDAMVDLPYNLQASVNAHPGVKAGTTPEFSVYAISMNQKKFAPFKDVHVIQAMNYAIDRNAIVRTVFFGHASPALSPIDKGILYWTGKYGYAYNPTKAKKLMSESKYPKGFNVTLLTVAGNSAQQGIATIMQSELKQLGIDLTIRPVDGTTQFELQQKETYQMVLEAGTSDNIDPNENMEFCCISNGGADSGYTGWHDPAADALYAKSQKEQNPNKRAQELAQWQKMILASGPFMWVVYPTNSFAYKDSVHQFYVQKTAHWSLWIVWKS